MPLRETARPVRGRSYVGSAPLGGPRDGPVDAAGQDADEKEHQAEMAFQGGSFGFFAVIAGLMLINAISLALVRGQIPRLSPRRAAPFPASVA